MTERITIIRNPNAGNRSGPFVDAVVRWLSRAGYPLTLLATDAPGHATDLAADVIKAGTADMLIAAGGDGTIREVAEGAYGTTMPVGLIPAGTANVLARDLGYMPGGRRSVGHVCHALMSKNMIDLYPFEVDAGGQTHLGFCWLGAGFDARVLNHVSPYWKRLLGRLAFTPATLKALLQERRAEDIPWQVAGEEATTMRWALLSNIQRYAGPFVLTRRAAVFDSGLATLLLDGTTAWARMGDQLALVAGRLDKRARTGFLKMGSVTLGTHKTPLQLDGDFLGYGPATVRPMNRTVKFRTGHIERRRTDRRAS